MNDPDSNKPKIINDDDQEILIRAGGPRKEEAAEIQGERIPIPQEAYVLPVRNVVIFPGTVVPLALGREKSRRLIHDLLPTQKIMITVCQRSPDTEDPGPEDLFAVGTATMVLKLLRMEEDNQSIIVHGLLGCRSRSTSSASRSSRPASAC